MASRCAATATARTSGRGRISLARQCRCARRSTMRPSRGRLRWRRPRRRRRSRTVRRASGPRTPRDGHSRNRHRRVRLAVLPPRSTTCAGCQAARRRPRIQARAQCRCRRHALAPQPRMPAGRRCARGARSQCVRAAARSLLTCRLCRTETSVRAQVAPPVSALRRMWQHARPWEGPRGARTADARRRREHLVPPVLWQGPPPRSSKTDAAELRA